jgi:hypothetical protein
VRLAVAALLLALAAGGTRGTADAADAREVQRPAPGPGRYADALRETVYVRAPRTRTTTGTWT